MDMDLQDIDFDEEVEEGEPVKQEIKQEVKQEPVASIRVKEEKPDM